MDMTINFLLQSTRILHHGNYDDDELNMIYNFLTTLDDEILNDYHNTCTILSYENDLELYIEILKNLILIFEEREEYEKCITIKNKMIESEIIMNTKLK